MTHHPNGMVSGTHCEFCRALVAAWLDGLIEKLREEFTEEEIEKMLTPENLTAAIREAQAND